MSGFDFNPPNTDADPPQPPAGDVVVCDGWWPSINLAAVRDAQRVGTTVTPQRLRDVIQVAMMDLARELAGWRAEQEAAGRNALADVPGRRMIAGESDYIVLWRRGILAIAGGELSERQLGQSTSPAGMDRAEQNSQDIDVHQRNVSFAVRDFLGRPRIIAEAI